MSLTSSASQQSGPDTDGSAASVGLALVTGAGKRLGRAIAIGLAQAGWDIAVHYQRSAADAAVTVADIQALGRRAEAFAANLAVEAEAGALLAAVQARMGLVGCLVNNASVFELDLPGDVGFEAIERHMRPNLAAPVLLARRLFESVRQDNRQACIVNLLDQKVENLNPDFFSYTLSKSALLAATRMMAIAFAPQIRVNGVSPGATLRSWEQSGEGFEQANRLALLPRSSRPQDIVAAVVYLVGAPAVTGINLVVDGGQHLMSLPRDVMFLTERF